MVGTYDTVNTQDFLYLKQLLCMVAVCRLNKILKIDGRAIDVVSVTKEANIVLDNLRDNFTVPVTAMRRNFSAVNLEFVLEATKILIQRRDDVEVKRVVEGQLSESQVFHRPDRKFLFNEFKREFLERNKLFETRGYASEILKQCDQAYNEIHAYLQHESCTVSIQIAIACCNVLETADYAFSVVEDGEKVFHDHSKDIEVIKND